MTTTASDGEYSVSQPLERKAGWTTSRPDDNKGGTLMGVGERMEAGTGGDSNRGLSKQVEITAGSATAPSKNGIMGSCRPTCHTLR